MAKSEMIRARVEPALKHDAEAVLDKLGMTPTEAITLFYKQVTLYRGLPFPVRIPNAAMRRALREARSRRNIETFDSAAAWAKAIRSA
jgi:DNA-damage-inducible protein J